MDMLQNKEQYLDMFEVKKKKKKPWQVSVPDFLRLLDQPRVLPSRVMFMWTYHKQMGEITILLSLILLTKEYAVERFCPDDTNGTTAEYLTSGQAAGADSASHRFLQTCYGDIFSVVN